VYDHERLNSIDNKINASKNHRQQKKEKKKKNEIKGGKRRENLQPKKKDHRPGNKGPSVLLSADSESYGSAAQACCHASPTPPHTSDSPSG
jgi:hypothetical protein